MKNTVIEELKKKLGFKSETKFSEFLGISRKTLWVYTNNKARVPKVYELYLNEIKKKD